MWIFFALASRLLWSGCNAADQILSRAHRRKKVLCVLVLQLCAYLPFSLIAFALSETISWSPLLLLWSLGILTCFSIALLPYYKCLQHEQSYNIVPYFELTPVFLTILALFFRHEHLTPLQMAAGALVIFCGFAFSWDFKHGKIKKQILLLMSASSIIFALQQLCMKNASSLGDAWEVAFYYTLTQSALGFVLLGVFKTARSEIVIIARETGGQTVWLALLSGALSFLAFASLTYAFSTAPTTGHVAAFSGTQPFFSFMLAAVLGVTIPKHFERLVMDTELKLKMLLLLGIVLGIYLLTMKASG